MPDWLIPTLGCVLFAVVASTAIWQWNAAARLEKRRVSYLAGVAEQLGWRFAPEDDEKLAERFPSVRLFDYSGVSCGFNRLSGTVPVKTAWGERLRYEVSLGDFRIAKGDASLSQVSHCRRLSYLLVRTPGVSRDTLSVRKEWLVDRACGLVRGVDIDFESKEFSDRFHVTASSRRFAYDILHPRMIEFLLTSPPVSISLANGLLWVAPEPTLPSIHWKFAGLTPPHIDHERFTVCHLSDGRWKREEFGAMIDWVAEFLTLWPRHLQTGKENADERG